MKSRSARRVGLSIVGASLLFSSPSFPGTGSQGFSVQGFSVQGFSVQGFSVQGAAPQGFSVQGTGSQGFSVQGVSPQGFSVQGFSVQGFSVQGFSVQGFSVQGFDWNGFSVQGTNQQGFSVQSMPLLGIDRQRGLVAPLEYRGTSYANVQTSADLQGVQAGTPINYVQIASLPTGIRLQAGPNDNVGAGSYIYVPNVSNTPKDIKGTFWNMNMADSTGATAAIGLYISDVRKDPAKNTSRDPSNDDVYLYTVYYRHPATQQWVSLCPVDPSTGLASAMAMPLNPNDWASDASRAKFTFACTASGVGAKCARNWGYKPWKSLPNEQVWLNSTSATRTIPLQPFYDACLISARADYCQDGQSYTKNGTMVDLFDTFDGFKSYNATAGMPYAPNSSGYMMHEEYQISALDLVKLPGAVQPQFAVASTDPILMSLSPEDKAAMLALRRSGLQSARYADLDPGRSCRASGYIDRCDPSDVYSCYRDDNMSENPYGAFIAVNSPRHCDHDEETDGAPLDPLCNSCVTRVCSVDPTCCGNAGNSYYPGSLVWDARCNTIRQKVCKSGPSDAVWNKGNAAPVAGSRPVTYLRGASGSLDGVVITGGIPYLEGWSCDPDFPGASSTIQVSVGGAIGAAGTRLVTARADLGHSNLGTRAEIAAECGAGRHAFRVQLLASDLGKAVYVYGLDLNTPGAPFSLLRGGQKTIPGAALPAPRAAIWSGWIEPMASGSHTFSVSAGANDSYRVWVNGQYVAAKWPSPDPTSPAGSFAAPTLAPSMYLQQGVRYGVRIEYLRTSTTDGASTFALRWLIPGASAAADVPTGALHPIDAGRGNGLLGSYYPADFTGTLYSQTYGAVDYVWTTKDLPGKVTGKAGLPLSGAFAARFEGQVMPPVSGTYTFTAESEGAVSIWVNGQAVASANQKPAGFADPATCEHDICRSGGAIDRACSQGYFCAAQICRTDPYCCSTTWDAACLQKVATKCNVDCRQTTPTEIVLRAGVKYDIKVELLHDATDYGAKLRLFWSLNGGARDTISADRLFAKPTPAPAASGYGLNGAYFSDVFVTQVLDHVDPTASFSLTALPKVDRAASIVCGYTGVACASDVIGPPGVTFPLPGQAITAPSIAFVGVGAVANATVTVSLTNRETNAAAGSTTGKADAMGNFTTSALALPTGKYSFKVSQTGSAASASTDFDFTQGDPNAPAAPAVNAPSLAASNGRLALSGTTAPNATVTISGAGGTQTVTAGTDGKWTLPAATPYPLPGPGAYQLVISSSAGGSTTVTATYTLPTLNVTNPSGYDQVVAATFNVTGTTPLAKGQVVVADGDGRYYFERPSSKANVAANGAFTVPVSGLDPGRHVLKIFQRLLNPDGTTTNLDGEAVVRSVLVKPAAPSGITITSPLENERVSNQVTIIGSGGPSRSALRYSVSLFQGTIVSPVVWTRIGQVDLKDDGTFELPVTLTGYGKTQLGVALIVRSLSGGGGAESDRSATVRKVVIAPPAPVLVTPAPATNPVVQATQTLAVSGNGISGAQVSTLIDGVALATKLTVTNGAFSGNVTVPKGVHTISFAQTLDGQMGEPTLLQSLRIGDVDPPKITVGKPAAQPAATTSETGVAVDVLTLRAITAADNGASLPLTCYPPVNTVLPVGQTTVVCKAQDAAGNIATTSQTIQVTNSSGPVLTGNSLIVEATGPQGAAVPYQVAATGLISNCGTGGLISPCSGWREVDAGLGFHVSSVAVDPKDGTTYANAYVDLGSMEGTLFRLESNGTWTKLAIPGPIMDPRDRIAFRLWSKRRLTVARGALATDPSTLYVPTEKGLLASSNRGATSKTLLTGVSVRAVSVDPANPKHIFAWNEIYRGDPGPVALFETTDGGVSWRQAMDGLEVSHTDALPYPHITDVVVDPVRPGWAYMQLAPYEGGTQIAMERVYRRKPGKQWERLVIPPHNYPFAERIGEAALAIAGNGNLFAAGQMSRDGGESWVSITGVRSGLVKILVDWKTPGRILGLDAYDMMVSTDNGEHFTNLGFDAIDGIADLTLDSFRPDVIYGPRQSGLQKTTDLGKTWVAIKAPGTRANTFTILDVATNPVDPMVAYMLSTDGFYRTGDGGTKWEARMAGFPNAGGTDLTLDPFNYQTLYASSPWGYAAPALLWTDNGDPSMPWTTTSFPGAMTAEPAFQGTFFSVVETAGTGSPGKVGIVRKSTAGVITDYALNVSGLEHPTMIQVFPDAARTVAVSYFLDGYTQGGTYAFSARDAQPAPAVTNVVPLLTGGPLQPVFDNSDGQDTLFVTGEALGGSRHQLYRASLADALARGNAAFSAYGDAHPPVDFLSLVIDRGSAGRVMYALSDSGDVWESQDRGLTWTEDATAPTWVRRIWPSSADGSLYANIGDRREGPESYVVSRNTHVGAQTMWKRDANALIPGANLVRGELRVKCVSGGKAYPPGSVFPIAKTTLTCTAVDAFKKTGTLAPAITIEVKDTTPPAFTFTPPAPVNVTSTDPNVKVAVPITATAVDKVDGARTPTCNFPAGNLYGVGVTPITCTVADTRGNSASTTFSVTVTRNGVATAPVLTVPAGVTLEGNALGGATLPAATISAIKATKSTGAALPAPTCTPALASTFAVGTTVVSCSTTDAGLTVTRSFPVTVTDSTGPVITTPTLGTTPSAGPTGAKVSFNVPATDVVDGCIAQSVSALPTGGTSPCAAVANAGLVTCAPASGSMFAQGRTTVTCRANDKRGNLSTKSFDVVVTDVNEPVVTVPASPYYAEAQDGLGAFVTWTATATDVEDGAVAVDCAPLSGSWFPFGNSTVSCQATDRNGNTGRATFTVQVADGTPPQISAPAGTLTFEAGPSAPTAAVTYVVRASDLVKPVITPVCTRSNGVNAPVAVTATGGTFPMGDSTVTCTATDDYGNVATKQFHVNVVDTTGPVFTQPLPAPVVQADATGTALVPYVVKATDLGLAVSVTCTPPPNSRFSFGTTTVSCVARDAAGNESLASFPVVVRDAVGPVIGAVSNKAAFATSTAGAVVTYTTPTANDVVEGARPVSCLPASGSTFPLNVSTVTCTSSDTSGNTTTKTFTVNVTYQVATVAGTIFQAPLLADGSAIIQRSRGSLDVAFALAGVSLPITNMTTARLTIAPVVNGVVGTFVAATPASGTGNAFAYDSVGKRYVMKMALGALADGTFRLRADLADGTAPREVDFKTVMTFTNLTLAADWTPGGTRNAYGPASALLDGVVYLRGGMSGTGSGRPFQLPVGQRPTATVTLPITMCDSVKGTLQIEADGWAYILGSGSAMSCFVSFEGVSYVVNNGANTALPLQPGWANAGAPWRAPTGTISSDIVHLAGAITTGGTNALAFTLPANMRPSTNVNVPINLCTPNKGRLFIAPSGSVSVVAEAGSIVGCAVSLEGVSFPVANTAAAGWTCLTPINGWVAAALSTRTPCVKNVDGVIHLSGAAQTGGTNMNALTLPVGMRPSKEAYMIIDLCSAGMGSIQVSPSGNVKVGYQLLSNAQCLSSFEGAAFSL